MNESDLYAVLDKEGTILVWMEDATSNWNIISIIIPPKMNINWIQWIINKNELIFVYQGYLMIWDPFENLLLHELEYNLIPHSIYHYQDIYLITSENGSISRWDGNKLIEISKAGPISWINENLFSFPNKIEFIEGDLVSSEIQMNRQEKQLSRQFRKIIEENVNLDIFLQGVYDFDKYFLPQFVHHFKDKELIIILVVNPFIVYQTEDIVIIQYMGDLNEKYIIINNTNFIISKAREKIILKNSDCEKIIYHDGNALKVKTSEKYFLEDSRSIENAPSYLFANHNQFQYGRINTEKSLMWIKDFHGSYVYFDLLGLETKIVDSVEYKDPKTKIMINEDLEYLLEWYKGNRYPNGRLFTRNLNTGELKLIYNQSDEITEPSQRSLVVNEWTCIGLFVYYKKKRKEIRLSLSSLYCILDRISRSSYEESFKHYQIREEINFIGYGDLVIEINKKKTVYHGISLIWKVDYSKNVLITVNYDGHCYVWNIIDNIPVSNFKQNTPHSIEIAPNKSLIAIISFDIKSTEFITEDKNRVSTDFPVIQLTVHDYEKNNTYRKSMRFPTHMQEFIVQVDFDEAANKFHFQFPSYIDNSNIISVLFDDTSNKFQIINPSSAKRYWQKHDEDASVEGFEFRVISHPEINREMTKRKYYFLDHSLVLRANDMLIVHAELDITQMKQLSSNPMYDEVNSVKMQMPFYNDQLKEIIILEENANLIRNDEFINLDSIVNFPKVLELNLNELPSNSSHLERIKNFILNVIRTKSYHSNYGIAYASQYYHEFHEKLLDKFRDIETLNS